jgi:hypothetical protein
MCVLLLMIRPFPELCLSASEAPAPLSHSRAVGRRRNKRKRIAPFRTHRRNALRLLRLRSCDGDHSNCGRPSSTVNLASFERGRSS